MRYPWLAHGVMVQREMEFLGLGDKDY
jgi:hypothetical protein